MAQRILFTILLISSVCLGETYQLANRADYPLGRTADGVRAAVPYATYTNATSWATGQMATNRLFDFSPDRTDMPMVDAPAVLFDGSADFARREIDVEPLGFCTIRGRFNLVDFVTDSPVFATQSRGVYGLWVDSGTETLFINLTNTLYTILTNTDYFVEAGYLLDGAGYAVNVNGSNVWTGTAEPEMGPGNWFYVGTSGSIDDFFSGTIWDVEVTGDNGFHWPMQENANDVLHDVGGNGRDGELQANGSSISNMWSGTQSQSFWGAEYGESKVILFDEDASYISFGACSLFTTASELIIRAKLNSGVYKKILADGVFVKLNSQNGSGSNTRLLFSGVSSGEWRTGVEVPYDRFIDLSIFYDGSNTGNDPVIRWRYVEDSAWTSTTLTESTPPSGVQASFSDLWIGSHDASGWVAQLSSVDIDGIIYHTKNAYSDVLPDSTGVNDATLVNTTFLYIPALADGTADAEGNPITNPKRLVLNNGQQGIVVGGVTNTYADLITHTNFSDSLVLSWNDDNFVSELLNLPTNYQWTADAYIWAENWQGTTPTTSLVPFEVTAGTGIGPNLNWFAVDDIYIGLFVSP